MIWPFRKWRYLGYSKMTARAYFFGKDLGISDYAIHFYESNDGKRKVKGDPQLLEDADVSAWLKGAPIDIVRNKVNLSFRQESIDVLKTMLPTASLEQQNALRTAVQALRHGR